MKFCSAHQAMRGMATHRTPRSTHQSRTRSGIGRAVLLALLVVLGACGGGGGGDVGGGSAPEVALSLPAFITGEGAPADQLGHDQQFYLDVTASPKRLYGPRANGRWPEGIPIDGTNGADGRDGRDGRDGVDGKDGQDGSRLLSGHGQPAAALGRDGDYFLDALSTALFGPRANGSWPVAGVSLLGPMGPEGMPGAAGRNGLDGKPGSQVYSGSGRPGAALGADGDYHFDTAGFVLYGPKTQGTWPASGLHLQGPTGAAGPAGQPGPGGQNGVNGKDGQDGSDGNHLLSGQGLPATTMGVDGDHYLDLQSGTLHGPKQNGEWSGMGLSLIGPAGSAGPQGLPGVNGQDGQTGNQMLSGAGAPLSTLGADGDHYLDTASATLYGPKAAGAWPASGLSLRGTKGDTGAKGPPGETGSILQAGRGQPQNSWGRDDDYYLDMEVSRLWGPKQAGTWSVNFSFSMIGATGPQGAQGPQGVPGPSGAAGASGKRSVNFSWTLMAQYFTLGNGTAYLLRSGGLKVSEHAPDLLPISCTSAILRAGTLGMPTPGHPYNFTVIHRPESANRTFLTQVPMVETALSCSISAGTTYCESTQSSLPWKVGDAIEVRMKGTLALSSMDTADAVMVGVYCEE